MDPPSRGSQSSQSVPQSQAAVKAPGPPSSQMPSDTHTVLLSSLSRPAAVPRQVFSQMACPGIGRAPA